MKREGKRNRVSGVETGIVRERERGTKLEKLSLFVSPSMEITRVAKVEGKTGFLSDAFCRFVTMRIVRILLKRQNVSTYAFSKILDRFEKKDGWICNFSKQSFRRR